jgi:putative glutamine amidotransferase
VVNSYHHQAVGRVAPGLRVVARCVDGGVEAVEGAGGFLLGVQWHPERDGCDEPFGRDLFRALLDAAGNSGRTAVRRTSNDVVG